MVRPRALQAALSEPGSDCAPAEVAPERSVRLSDAIH